MAVKAVAKLNAHTLRADFPIFEQKIHGKPLAFLDSAASSQKPRQVLDAMTGFYTTSYANVHRGVYVLAERATEALEHARERVRAFLNAPDAREVIFTRNATEGINPVGKIAEWAHAQGAIYVCDAAQGAPHTKVDVQALGVDFLAISGHKMCGPSGASALWGRTELLLAMDPFLTGGHMINSVRLEKTTWGELPHKFEAGTAPMAEAVGLRAAIDYLEAVGLEAIEAHEHELAAYALGRLSDIPGITLYGPPADRRAGIVSFNIDGVHPHDVAQILDMQGVAIRARHHCCQPLMQKLGVAATNRASCYLYTVPEEIDQLVDGLHTVNKVFA